MCARVKRAGHMSVTCQLQMYVCARVDRAAAAGAESKKKKSTATRQKRQEANLDK